jgi:hypothetical protein
MANDGGPAFPHIGWIQTAAGPIAVTDERVGGMSLRDYFAAKASKGVADSLCDAMEPDDPNTTFDPVQRLADVRRHAEQHARMAYLYADSMLKARENT